MPTTRMDKSGRIIVRVIKIPVRFSIVVARNRVTTPTRREEAVLFKKAPFALCGFLRMHTKITLEFHVHRLFSLLVEIVGQILRSLLLVQWAFVRRRGRVDDGIVL